MKLTKRQLRGIIREAIDVVNASTGELLTFHDNDPGAHAPELAARDIMKRLKIEPISVEKSMQAGYPWEEIEVSSEDWAVMDVELGGKRHARKQKKEYARLDIDNLLNRARSWAAGAGEDLASGNLGVEGDPQNFARDLALGAEGEFKEDEWDELIWHFDNNEDFLIDFIADEIVG
jgi:hypothetical protein